MNPDPNPGPQGTVEAFLLAIKTIFGGEPWGDIEPYAKRAWSDCRSDTDPTWEEIEHRVRTEWQ